VWLDLGLTTLAVKIKLVMKFHKGPQALTHFLLDFCLAGVGVLEGPLYAVGGHDGWSYLNTVERWDPQARQWSYVAPMSTQRSSVGVAVLNSK
jgi:hypothetical protein